MAKVVGYSGKVDWGDIVSDVGYNVTSWSLDYTADPLDSTDFESTGFRTFVTGLKQWSGSLEVLVDDTNELAIADVGTTATLQLYTDGTNYYEGDAICTGIHPVVNVDGLQTQTLDFQGTSDLSWN